MSTSRPATSLLAGLALVLAWQPVDTAAGGRRQTSRARLAVEAAVKYDSNLDLAFSPKGIAGRDDLGTELSARGQIRRRLGDRWWVSAQGATLGTVYREHDRSDWLFGRAAVTAGRPLWGGTLELSNQSRYYSRPRREEFDFIRNVALLRWRRPVGRKWEVGVGLDHAATDYPHAGRFDYALGGASVEWRRRWNQDLSAYAQVDWQRYGGTATPEDPDPRSSPDEGKRRVGRLGLDWLLAAGRSLSLTYALQVDRAELGLNQIGAYEGHEDTQDSDAEFDLTKQKATALFTWPLGPGLLLSSYLEYIDKDFDNDDDLMAGAAAADPSLPGLTDRLWLSSTHVKVRLGEHWGARLRYLFRTNDSSRRSRVYTDHIITVGLFFER